MEINPPDLFKQQSNAKISFKPEYCENKANKKDGLGFLGDIKNNEKKKLVNVAPSSDTYRMGVFCPETSVIEELPRLNLSHC